MATVKRIVDLISNTKTADEAVTAISNAFPKISNKAAQNILKDFTDFKDGHMTLKELEHWVSQYGL